jgi:ribosomal protein L15
MVEAVNSYGKDKKRGCFKKGLGQKNTSGQGYNPVSHSNGFFSRAVLFQGEHKKLLFIDYRFSVWIVRRSVSERRLKVIEKMLNVVPI